MSDTDPSARAESDDARRDAALEAWTQGKRVGPVPARPPTQRPGGSEQPPDEFAHLSRKRRHALPTSFLLAIAVAAALWGVEPAAELAWRVSTSATPLELGEPANYRFERLQEDAFVRVEGIASPRRGSYTRSGEAYEVFALVGTPLLVRKEKSTAPRAPDVAELMVLEGRVLKLEPRASGFFERLVRPASRYNSLKLKFDALGELPPGRTAFLLLDGQVPRLGFLSLLFPLALWGLSLTLVGVALRRALERRKRRPA